MEAEGDYGELQLSGNTAANEYKAPPSKPPQEAEGAYGELQLSGNAPDIKVSQPPPAAPQEAEGAYSPLHVVDASAIPKQPTAPAAPAALEEAEDDYAPLHVVNSTAIPPQPSAAAQQQPPVAPAPGRAPPGGISFLPRQVPQAELKDGPAKNDAYAALDGPRIRAMQLEQQQQRNQQLPSHPDEGKYTDLDGPRIRAMQETLRRQQQDAMRRRVEEEEDYGDVPAPGYVAK